MSVARPAPAPLDASSRDATFSADDTLVFVDPPVRRRLIQATAIAATAVYLGYLIYRAAYTINWNAPVFSVLVYLAEIHGFFSLVFFFHEVWAIRRRTTPAPPPGLTVDVFITTYNEDEDLLRKTLRAAVAMRYPHETYVLDDGRRESVRALAAEIGCHYVTRATNEHAKAGNWNNAFRQTTGDVIATFDADHVPRPEFLERTIGFFRDPKMALVQVPQLYHNLDSVQHTVSWQRRRMYSEQDAFFHLVMPGKDHWNAAFFCGTGAVLRRSALTPHGGIMTGTITEDLHTSVVLHSEGWKSAYVDEALVTGLAPMDLRSFELQRLRWAEGNLKVAGHINPVTAPGLSFAQRLSYFASLYHWTIGFPKFIYYLAPPWMLISGTFPIANFDRTFLAIYLTFLVTLIAAYQITSRFRGRLVMDELFNMVSFFTLMRAMKRVIFGRGKPAKFLVTDKKGSAKADYRPVLPHLALLLISLWAVTWSVMGLGFGVSDDLFGAGTAIFWTFYNVALMVLVIRIGTRAGEKRTDTRFRAHFAVEAIGDRAEAGPYGVTADVSDSGCALLWPVALERGSRIPLRFHFGSKSADWTGQVVSDLGVSDGGWHRYGIEFQDLTRDDVDLISDSVYNIVVPETFATLSEPSWIVQWHRRVERWMGRASAVRAQRKIVRLPVRIDHAGHTIVTTAHDLSDSGVGVVAPMALANNARVLVSIFAPDRLWTGTASVARCQQRRASEGFDTWLIGLRFDASADLMAFEPFTAEEAA